MVISSPTSAWPEIADTEAPDAGDERIPALEAPPVVAVVVTTGGPWLGAAIASLATTGLPGACSVLVLDNGADDRPHRPHRQARCRKRSCAGCRSTVGFAARRTRR